MTKTMLMGARLCALFALALGIARWLGYAAMPVHLHMTVGAIFVLLLWFLSFKAMGTAKGIALAGFLVGLVVPIVGYAQLTTAMGGGQWSLQLAHVVLAIGAIGLAEMAGKRARLAGV
ncbi:hypothetical protein [Afifella sp. IM 167]|uniref:hypothetical protein n=1 Tax=Afifella sp. IM 167 TaxID=2033586 RepID=UPI001CCBB121|nr:hypothetical protein [Afifella sp. IM 167]MBZ8131865.1 hypothetical protein [Afifella sp. IM 167]